MEEPCEVTKMETTPTPKKWTIGAALSDEKGIPSTSRTLLAMAVVFALGLAAGALCVQRTLTPDIRGLVETVLWVAAGAYGIPRAVAAGVAK